MWLLMLFSLIVPAVSQNVFLSGILNQSNGMAVICVGNGKANELVRFNELRPAPIDIDWTRSFIGLHAIMVQDDYLYYYLPSHSTESGHGGAIFRRMPGRAPEMICEVPSLNSICKRPGMPQIVAVTKDNQIAVIDMTARSTRIFNLDRQFAFASWTRNGKKIVASTSHNAEIVSIDVASGQLDMDHLIDTQATIRRVYAMTNGVDYLLQYGSDICVFASDVKSLRRVKSSRIPLVSDLLYCESNGMVYVLVPDDNDGRTLVILDPNTGKGTRIVKGVFDDAIIGD